MDRIKKIAVSTKNHFATHKAAYAMGLVAVSAIALQQSNRKAFYAFLEEKDIDPMEFYCPEYYEELNS
jgi:hypothetical protein